MNKTIPTHYHKKQWYKDITFNIEPIEDVFEKVGDKLFKPHQLDFHQFLFISEGSGTHEVDFETIELKPHTIVPLIVGQVQCYKRNQKIKGFAIVFTSDFLIRDKINLKYLYNFTLFNTLIKPLQLNCSPEIVQLISLLHDSFVQKNEFEFEEILRSYLKVIIVKLEQLKRQLTKTTIGSAIELSIKFNEELEKKISYKTKISDICKELNSDCKKISEAIKSTTNKRPKQILDERIVLELKRLIVYTDYPIKEIALQLGFDEASNLTNFFKRRTGLSPTEFRMANQ